ncbi:MAG: trypsin-like peptidase domain-containing protein, partial [Pirellulales bacterium]
MTVRSRIVGTAVLACSASLFVAAESNADEPNNIEPNTTDKQTWARVYEECKGSIMRVEIARPVDGEWEVAVGSAFLITEDGYALTNVHVMGDGQGDRKVVFHDGSSYPFTIIGTSTKMDAALIKIETRGKEVTFKPLGIGRSNELRERQAVAALGNPGGKGLTISSGIITGLNRGSSYEWGGAATWRDDMVQVNARIIGGNSGGPLISERGDVIGLVCNSRPRADRVSFALPIDAVVQAVPEFVKVEDRNDFVTGLVVDPLVCPTVKKVVAGSAGETAGLRPDDVIVAINGKKMATGMDYCLALLDCAADEVLTLSIRRKGAGAILQKRLTLERVKPMPPVAIEGLVNGLDFKFYDASYQRVPDFQKLEPDESGTTDAFRVDAYAGRDGFSMQFSGYVRVPADGKYTFYARSDDGSLLFIGDRLVVDNDGLHAPFEQGGVVTLMAGHHAIRVGYIEGA